MANPHFFRPGNLRVSRFALTATLTFCLTAEIAAATKTKQEQEQDPQPEGNKPRIEWQHGPVKAKLGTQAEIDLPEGYLFADAANTVKFLEVTQNIPNGRELGTIGPRNGSWFAVFEFEDVGYVKDDEKDKLDADAILKSIKEGTEQANEERKKRGWAAFHITGWITPPHYDDLTHQLTWSIIGQSDGGTQSANYRTRLLGRRGVMSVELLVDPTLLDSALPVFTQVVNTGYTYTPENQYSAFVKGDKVAEYGLGALIVGGVAAAAVKTGFFKIILKALVVGWKLVVVGVGAGLAFLKRLFTRRKRQEPESIEASK